MIDDNELRALFQAESDEHLQSLDEGLLRLEADTGDSDTLQRIFRDAHSLKGSARMLGIAPVEQVAHRFEDVLGAARRGEVPLTPAVVSRLYETLDTIRALVGEALTGVSARINLPGVLASLDDLEQQDAEGSVPSDPGPEADRAPTPSAGEPDAPAETSPAASEESSPDEAPAARSTTPAEALPATTAPEPAPVSVPPTPPAQPEPPPTASRPSDSFRVDTIRVDSRKLDDLMLRAGELVVTGGRIEQRARNVANVGDRWTELYREMVASEAGASPSEAATRAGARGPGAGAHAGDSRRPRGSHR